MILAKLLFFSIGLFGLLIVWTILGFVFVACNQEIFQHRYSIIEHLKKMIFIGPMYVFFIICKCRNKKER